VAVVDQPADPGPAIAAARVTLEIGDPHGAAQAAWRLVQDHPDRLDARLLLASANVLQGRYAEALEHADVALRLDPASADAYTNRGAALHGLGRPDEALNATEAALAYQSDHQGALRNAARLHGEAERWLAQKAALLTLARLRPADAEVRLLLARNRAHAGDFQGALHAIEASLERAPDNPALHTFMATVLYQLDRLEPAMDHANIALRLDPERRDARLVFEAAFYVRVASNLRCAHGESPWSDAAVTAALAPFEGQGVVGVDRFREVHARQGKDESVMARVARIGACDP
jgi:tetratricopeptide (TPR) repeat protein